MYPMFLFILQILIRCSPSSDSGKHCLLSDLRSLAFIFSFHDSVFFLSNMYNEVHMYFQHSTKNQVVY
jgi:hypothetical protein